MTTGFRTLTGTVTGQAGSLITFIDSLLDIGGAGPYWTKEFTGTNKAAYRATVGERYYLRVDDAAGQLAGVRGYSAMSDVDTGSDIFPTTTQQTNWTWRKSNTADATARTVFGLATDRFFLLLVSGGWAGGGQDLVFFGEPKRLVPGDTGVSVLRAVPLAAMTGVGFTSGASPSSDLALTSYATPANNNNGMMPFAKAADGATASAAGLYFKASTNVALTFAAYPVIQCWPVTAGSAFSGSTGIPRALIPFVFTTQLAGVDAGLSAGDTFTDQAGASYLLATPDGTGATSSSNPFIAIMTTDHELGLA